jgi:hypothetical protein
VVQLHPWIALDDLDDGVLGEPDAAADHAVREAVLALDAVALELGEASDEGAHELAGLGAEVDGEPIPGQHADLP